MVIQAMAAFYHYTTMLNYNSMLDGSGYGRPGLLPVRRYMPLGLREKFNLPAHAECGVTYGLTAPVPVSWNRALPYVDCSPLEKMVLEIPSVGETTVLLRAITTPQDDVRIANHACRLQTLSDSGLESYQKKIWSDHWNSLVSASDYEHGTAYLMPEVLCFSDIPPERLQLVRVYETRIDAANDFRMASNRPLLQKPDFKSLDAFYDQFFPK